MKRSVTITMTVLLALSCVANAATYYISPTGNDSDAGTEGAPFASLMHAQEVASNGDTIIFLPGVYEDQANGAGSVSLYVGIKTNGLFMSNLKVLGSGVTETILRPNSNAYFRNVVMFGDNNAFGNMKIEANVSGGYGTGVELSAVSNSFIHDLWIELPPADEEGSGIQVNYRPSVWNNTISNVLVDGGSAGVKERYWDGASPNPFAHQSTFINCTFVNQQAVDDAGDEPGASVYIQTSPTVFDKCVFANAEFHVATIKSFYAATQTFNNSVWWNSPDFASLRDGNSYVVQNSVDNADPQFVTVEGCDYIASGTYEGYGFVISAAGGATYYISPTGDDANAGTEGAPFASLMHAQEVASNGDTIIFLPGVYEDQANGAGSVSLYVGIKTNGLFMSNLKVLGSGVTETILRPNSNAYFRNVVMFGDTNEFGNMKIEANVSGGYGTGVELSAVSNSFIHDLWIELPPADEEGSGIQVNYRPSVWNNTISNVLVDGGSAGVKERYWDGASPNPFAHQSTFINCTFVNQQAVNDTGDEPGAAVYIQTTPTVFDKCVFANAEFHVATIQSAYASTQTFNNSVWWNSPDFASLRDGNSYVVQNSVDNADPQFVTVAGCDYIASGPYFGYGFILIPEPGIIGGMLLLAGLLIRRK